MKNRFTLRATKIIAILGMSVFQCLASSSSLEAEETREGASLIPSTTTIDARLDPAGRLFGQVVNTEGIPLAHVPITLSSEGSPPVQVLADAEGRFSGEGFSGGIVALETEGCSLFVRAWAHESAPPAATSVLMVVVQEGAIARAQLLGDPFKWSLVGSGILIGGAVIVSTQNSASGS